MRFETPHAFLPRHRCRQGRRPAEMWLRVEWASGIMGLFPPAVPPRLLGTLRKSIHVADPGVTAASVRRVDAPRRVAGGSAWRDRPDPGRLFPAAGCAGGQAACRAEKLRQSE